MVSKLDEKLELLFFLKFTSINKYTQDETTNHISFNTL